MQLKWLSNDIGTHHMQFWRKISPELISESFARKRWKCFYILSETFRINKFSEWFDKRKWEIVDLKIIAFLCGRVKTVEWLRHLFHNYFFNCPENPRPLLKSWRKKSFILILKTVISTTEGDFTLPSIRFLFIEKTIYHKIIFIWSLQTAT